MKVYKHTDIFHRVRANAQAPYEDAWLVIDSEDIRAIWHRRDGTLIRPWSGDTLGPSIEGISDDFIEVSACSIDPSFAVDEGL